MVIITIEPHFAKIIPHTEVATFIWNTVHIILVVADMSGKAIAL